MLITKTIDLFKSLSLLRSYPNIGKELFLRQIVLCNVIDRNIIGRYCGTYQDRLSQMTSCASLLKKFPNNQKHAHLEIGVLFGGSIIAKAKILNKGKSKHTLIAIDPFHGYYGENIDPLSGVKVSKSVFKRNLRIFGLDQNNIIIIDKFSSNKDILTSISTFKVISIMIDGDHSFQGVKSDWEMYTPLLLKGGYLLIDNYRDPRWPEVTKCVDEKLVKEKNKWILKSRVCYTLVLEKN